MLICTELRREGARDGEGRGRSEESAEIIKIDVFVLMVSLS